jgi:hypothetical protein
MMKMLACVCCNEEAWIQVTPVGGHYACKCTLEDMHTCGKCYKHCVCNLEEVPA